MRQLNELKHVFYKKLNISAIIPYLQIVWFSQGWRPNLRMAHRFTKNGGARPFVTTGQSPRQRQCKANLTLQRAFCTPGPWPGAWIEHRFEMLACLSLWRLKLFFFFFSFSFLWDEIIRQIMTKMKMKTGHC